MSRPETGDDRYLRKERSFFYFFSFCLSLLLAVLVFQAWYDYSFGHPDLALALDPNYHAFEYAPQAYRIGMPALIHLATRRMAVASRITILPILDFFFTLGTLFLLYPILVRGVPAVRRVERMMRIVLFFAFLHIPLVWVLPFRRPETTPTALFLVLSLFCLLRSRRQPAWNAVLAFITVWQSFVRSDVAMIFGGALFLLSLFGANLEEFGTRGMNLLRGFAMGAIAVGIQAYLQFVLFPHRVYDPAVPMFALPYNLARHSLWNSFVVFLPLAPVVVLAARQRRFKAVELLALASAALYMPLWWAVGRTPEVRIYVPFLIILCLPSVEVVVRWLALTQTEEVPG